MPTAELVLEFSKVLVWPITLIILLIVYREAILSLLPKSKVKISLFGLEVETTFPELEKATLATLGGKLSTEQFNLLTMIAQQGSAFYGEAGIPKSDREWIRQLVNAGLLMTVPSGSHLGAAQGLALTPLGNMIMRRQV